ncbi:MAG: AAA family ATPase [Chloroflexales bacterium]
MPDVLLITGAMAAGKSSLAQALAERLPRSVHLRGDVFRRMIVGGRAAMSVPLSDEAERQLDLRYRLAVDAARTYVAAGFTVVYQDVILGPVLGDVVRRYAGLRLAVVVLCPRPEVLAAREAGRAKRGYPDAETITTLDYALRADTPRLGLWLDTSDLPLAESVEQVLACLAEAIIA